jgi:hypothetical protein
MIDVDEVEIVELLKDEVTWVKQDIAPFVSTDAVQKHFERNAIMEVFARVQLEAEIDANRVKGVENRRPTFCQLVECYVN